MRLTDTGATLLTHAQLVMKTMEGLYTAIDDITHSRVGSFKLGLPPVIGVSFFPSIIAQFQKQYPHIELKLIEEGSKKIEEGLLEGTIDVGVVVLPVDVSNFELVPLVERKLQLIVSPDHPLSGRNHVDLIELQHEPFILFREGFSLYDRVRDACIREGFEPVIASTSSQWDLISEMIAVNLGVSFLPETVCSKLNPEFVTVIPNVTPAINWHLGVIWNKHHYLSHAARGWIQFVEHTFAAESKK
jgi:DNA-binding transcriptional LysR family regulator